MTVEFSKYTMRLEIQILIGLRTPRPQEKLKYPTSQFYMRSILGSVLKNGSQIAMSIHCPLQFNVGSYISTNHFSKCIDFYACTNSQLLHSYEDQSIVFMALGRVASLASLWNSVGLLNLVLISFC